MLCADNTALTLELGAYFQYKVINGLITVYWIILIFWINNLIRVIYFPQARKKQFGEYLCLLRNYYYCYWASPWIQLGLHSMLSYFKSDALFKGWIELQTKVRFFKTSVYTLKSVGVFVSCFEEKNIHTVLFYSTFPEHSFPRRIQHFRADSWMTFKVGSKSSYRLFRRKKKSQKSTKIKVKIPNMS